MDLLKNGEYRDLCFDHAEIYMEPLERRLGADNASMDLRMGSNLAFNRISWLLFVKAFSLLELRGVGL